MKYECMEMRSEPNSYYYRRFVAVSWPGSHTLEGSLGALLTSFLVMPFEKIIAPSSWSLLTANL